MANEAGLEPIPTWLAVLTYIEAGRQVFYKAPMDRQPVRVTAVRGKGSYRYKAKITPPAATLRRNHPDRVDPFWADAGHRDRFWRIPDERHREIIPQDETAERFVHIGTPYGHRYQVSTKTGRLIYIRKEGGTTEGSDQWKITGVTRTDQSFGRPISGGLAVLEQLAESNDLLKANGKPKYTLMDLDHGTTRAHGNPDAHGILSVRFIARPKGL